MQIYKRLPRSIKAFQTNSTNINWMNNFFFFLLFFSFVASCESFSIEYETSVRIASTENEDELDMTRNLLCNQQRKKKPQLRIFWVDRFCVLVFCCSSSFQRAKCYSCFIYIPAAFHRNSLSWRHKNQIHQMNKTCIRARNADINRCNRDTLW